MKPISRISFTIRIYCLRFIPNSLLFSRSTMSFGFGFINQGSIMFGFLQDWHSDYRKLQTLWSTSEQVNTFGSIVFGIYQSMFPIGHPKKLPTWFLWVPMVKRRGAMSPDKWLGGTRRRSAPLQSSTPLMECCGNMSCSMSMTGPSENQAFSNTRCIVATCHFN